MTAVYSDKSPKKEKQNSVDQLRASSRADRVKIQNSNFYEAMLQNTDKRLKQRGMKFEQML